MPRTTRAPRSTAALRLAGHRRIVALRASSPIAPAVARTAGAFTPRVSPRGHAAATLVAGLTCAPDGAAAEGEA